MNQVAELQRRIEELEKRLNAFSDYSLIPYEVQQAFRENLPGIISSAPGHTGETQAVDETGSNSYSVMAPADRFVKTVLENGVLVYLPAFNA